MINLSPAEYELMLHLARFAGLVLAASGVGTIFGVLAVRRFKNNAQKEGPIHQAS